MILAIVIHHRINRDRHIEQATEAKPISVYRQAFDERHLQREDPITRKHQTLISVLMTLELPDKKCQPKTAQQDDTEEQKINLATFSFCFYYFYNAFCFSRQKKKAHKQLL